VGAREPHVTRVTVRRFAPAHLAGFRALFDAVGSGCACRFWHFEGTKNAWLERSALRPDESFAEQEANLRAGDPTASGLVAVRGEGEAPRDGEAGREGEGEGEGEVVGWMKLAPRTVMAKLTHLPVYRAIPPLEHGLESRTWLIGCFLVHPAHRRAGIARALLLAADAHVRDAGGAVIEGFPRRSTAPLHDEEAWQGPETLFRELGYRPIEGPLTAGAPSELAAPYPLYRKIVAREHLREAPALG